MLCLLTPLGVGGLVSYVGGGEGVSRGQSRGVAWVFCTSLYLVFWAEGMLSYPAFVSDPLLLLHAEDVRDSGSIPGFGRSPGGEHGNPLQYSCLKIPWTEELGGPQSSEWTGLND